MRIACTCTTGWRERLVEVFSPAHNFNNKNRRESLSPVRHDVSYIASQIGYLSKLLIHLITGWLDSTRFNSGHVGGGQRPLGVVVVVTAVVLRDTGGSYGVSEEVRTRVARY